jgi:hypothetical protein
MAQKDKIHKKGAGRKILTLQHLLLLVQAE